MLFKKKIVLIALVLVCMLGYVVFSDEVDTMYTEFYFISGGNNYDTITVNLTGGETGIVVYGLDNKSIDNLPVKISFVDSVVIDESNNLRACLSENEIENFGQYVSTSPNSFTVLANNLTTGEIEMNFPAWFSGVYYGCVIYEPSTTVGNSHLNTVARKAIFLDVDVRSTYKNFDVVVRPAFRVDGGDGYGFSGADFWLFVDDGGWKTLYNSAKGDDDKINTDENGVADISVLPPGDGMEYMVVFKGSGSLSIGYTGIWDETITQFNLFSGSIANSMLDDFVLKYYDGSDTGNYIRMGDISANNSGNYDLIKDTDFSLMTYNLTRILDPDHPDWFDFDKNDVVNSLEQTMVMDSYNRVGFISLQNQMQLSDFIDI